MRIKIEYKGKMYTLPEIVKLTKLSYDCIKHRYDYGWTPEEIIETPVNSKFQKKQPAEPRVIDLRRGR